LVFFCLQTNQMATLGLGTPAFRSRPYVPGPIFMHTYIHT
jgi:hypothetical protein